ncbi:hypothetical protein NliqN6_5364 [Naganishia liquefaciens]|uniref:NAD(P)-binding protein n=1 Tax=Naganishia liquefaciens TaxID=104408 RepID=A0A8H3YI89_9TREE|nr:hypothetical protein NliqN6_5364 [Naganishia liquefaciens]
MSSSPSQGPFILVSGANRGIGLDLVKNLVQQHPQAVVFAGARDPTSATALNEIASKNGNVHVIQLTVDDEESNKKAVDEVKKITERLDIVIANAGINSPFVPLQNDDIAMFKTNFQVNTLGPVYLYQATFPLLVATRETDPSLPAPKFFITSSLIASFSDCPPMFLNGSYGASKAAANYVAHVIHEQTEKYNAVVIPYHPGLVATDMGAKSAAEMGVDFTSLPGAISPEQAGKEYADLVTKATRAEHGGKFWGQGIAEPIPW